MWSYNNVCVDTGMKRQVVFYPLYSVVITVTSKSFMLRFCIMLVVKQLYNRSELLTLSCEYQDGFFYDFADFFFNFIFLVNYNKTKASSGLRSRLKRYKNHPVWLFWFLYRIVCTKTAVMFRHLQRSQMTALGVAGHHLVSHNFYL